MENYTLYIDIYFEKKKNVRVDKIKTTEIQMIYIAHGTRLTHL